MIRSKRLLDYSKQYLSTREVVFTSDSTPELRIRLEDFEAMGRPLEITVTIEPGDTLNDHPKGAL